LAESGTRVVVTGLGAVSPYGRGASLFWGSLAAGKVALRPITLFDASEFRNALAGEVPGYPCEAGSTRAVRFLLDAAREAAESAGLSPGSFDPARAGVVTGTNFGGMSAAEDALSPGSAKASLGAYGFGSAADAVASSLGLEGERWCLSLSCASGAAVILAAAEVVRRGRADVMLAAGYDELSLYCYAGLSALRAISKDTIRPFSLNRSGTIFSEGAGCVVVEERSCALRRGARPIAEVLGGAMNNDAYHMTAPEKEGRGIRAVMAEALRDSGLRPEEIDHVNAHATGTQYNDAIETACLKSVFGEHARRLTVTANKSMIGHAMGAAGALESMAAALTIREGVIPPTMNLDEPDPACDLDYVPGSARRSRVRAVLKTSFGMGGTNAALVLGEASR
jgi:3-oxoacyl-(acyl-carrier-protein) synthase